MNLNTELPKEVVEKAYQAIESARKTGKIKKGTNEVTKSIERGVSKLVCVAKDVNPKEIVMHIPVLCEEKGVPVVVVSSKDELGAAAGMTVGTSAVVIVKEGDAKNLIADVIKRLENGK